MEDCLKKEYNLLLLRYVHYSFSQHSHAFNRGNSLTLYVYVKAYLKF